MRQFHSKTTYTHFIKRNRDFVNLKEDKIIALLSSLTNFYESG